MGTDITPFSNSKCLCRWARLISDNNKSAVKKLSG
nr:hypothetical protein [uncultured Anaerostipes sp.]